MRSYDWRMPEEKYRKTIDHLSDRIYSYLPSYKKQGLNEGISENIIKVTGNPIVDILKEFKVVKFTQMYQYQNQHLSLQRDLEPIQ